MKHSETIKDTALKFNMLIKSMFLQKVCYVENDICNFCLQRKIQILAENHIIIFEKALSGQFSVCNIACNSTDAYRTYIKIKKILCFKSMSGSRSLT